MVGVASARYSNSSAIQSNQIYRYFESAYPGENEYYSGFQDLTWSNLKARAFEADWWDISSRTINFEGVDLSAIMDRVVAPSGLVTQFALSLEIDLITTVGWLISGVIWNFLLDVTSGNVKTFLAQLVFLFGPQALALNIFRSLWSRFLEIVSRVTAAMLIYGPATAIKGMFTVTPQNIGDFIFNPLIVILGLGRGTLSILFIFAAAPFLWLMATQVWPNIRTFDGFGKRQSAEGIDSLVYPELFQDQSFYSQFTQTRMFQDWIPEMLEDSISSIISMIQE